MSRLKNNVHETDDGEVKSECCQSDITAEMTVYGKVTKNHNDGSYDIQVDEKTFNEAVVTKHFCSKCQQVVWMANYIN